MFLYALDWWVFESTNLLAGIRQVKIHGRWNMLDLEKALTNTEEGIQQLQAAGIEVPIEAFELAELYRRCIAAEKLVNARSQSASLGELAYVAYCKHSGGKSLVSGADLPNWSDLSQQIKQAWVASSQAVFERVLSRLHCDADAAPSRL